MPERTGRRLTAVISVTIALTLVGCGISAQSPAPGSRAPGSSSGPGGSASATSIASQPVASATSAAPGGSSGPSTPSSTATVSSLSPGTSLEPTTSVAPSDAGPSTPQPTLAGQVSFGNWPLYIDINEENGNYPTLKKFTEQTGIQVAYHEDINDNTEFFGKVQPDLAAGNPIGYDVIVPSDWMVAKMIRLGYLQPLDKSLLPNFEANVQDTFRDPWYDPGNVYSIPWQAGIVGIGYNPKLTGREITSFDDLLDPAFAGKVGLFSEMIDTMSMTLLSMGIDPPNATIEDVQAAHDKLLAPAQAGQFRAFYGNDYYDALAAGDVALTMAWSGDISQMQLYDNPDVKFVVPDTGGMLFVDNMVLPNNVEHLADAYKLMDYWYTLEAAVPLTEYIGYFSPVKGVPEQVQADADAERAAGHPINADHLDQIAKDSFPSAEDLANIHQYKPLTEDEERQWNDLFNEIVNG